MQHVLSPRAALTALACCLAIPAAAQAQGPPPPTAANGATVETLGGGVPTPTSFAFLRGKLFIGAGGTEPEEGVPAERGGVFRLRDGAAVLVPRTPAFVSGVATRAGRLYIASGNRIIRKARFRGGRFRRSKTIFRGPEGFSGFGGIAFGHDGRLYAGVALNPATDEKNDTSPYARSVISMTARGKDVKVVSTGLRQPWQLTFVKGQPDPFVSVLADEREPVAPDWIVHAKSGQNYGYPGCTQLVKRNCRGFAKPIALLDAHASPMGITSVGSTLYVALFGGPSVVSMNTSGKQVKPFLTGYVAPVLALTQRRGFLYTGDLTGTIYRVNTAG